MTDIKTRRDIADMIARSYGFFRYEEGAGVMGSNKGGEHPVLLYKTTNADNALTFCRLMRQRRRRQMNSGPIWNPEHEGWRWCENLNRCGLDSWMGSHMSHVNGNRRSPFAQYYMNDYFDETVEGVVVKLPSRRGAVRFLIGYSDSCNPNAARLSTTINEFPKPEDDYQFNEYLEEAMQMADEEARCMAENAREESEAYDAGYDTGMLSLDCDRAKKELVALLKERREFPPDQFDLFRTQAPATAATVCRNIVSMYHRLVELREQRDERMKTRDYLDEDKREIWDHGFSAS